MLKKEIKRNNGCILPSKIIVVIVLMFSSLDLCLGTFQEFRMQDTFFIFTSLQHKLFHM